MKLFCFGVLASAALLISAPAPFDPAQYLQHVKVLASPEMKGRASGSPELEEAAAYIAGQYRSFGLRAPAGTDLLQAFPITTSAKLGRKNTLDVSVGQDRQTIAVNQEFIPFNFSSKGKASGKVVFAGYGITAPEYNYDDYAGLDVKGKFVVVLRHEPQEYDEKSIFAGKVYTDHAQFYSKAANAKRHGAIGVILVNDSVNHRSDSDELEPFQKTEGPADAGLLFLQVKESVAAPWFRSANKDLPAIEQEIDKDLKPRSFPLPQVEVQVAIDIEHALKTVHNVAAYLPGQTSEYVIIGAHYDHLGLGEQFSLAPSLAGTVHPGADDNASGTAGVLELARYFASQPKMKRGLLFVSFAGEEIGLLGSGFYAAHPELPLDQAVAMINLDMIGRVRDGKLFVGGAGTGSTLRQDLDAVTPHYSRLKVDYSDKTGYGSSDHYSFTVKQVPVLFFFSGLHSDYHKPSDTWEKIDAPDAVQVVKMVAEIATKLASDADRPQFVRVNDNPHAGSEAGGSGSSGSGYGPYFGSIPDFSEPPQGVRFSDVRDGSPAGKAGLKAGDILVKFGDRDIRNLYDFTYALRAHQPGDLVEVEVLRDNQRLKAKVLLTKRN